MVHICILPYYIDRKTEDLEEIYCLVNVFSDSKSWDFSSSIHASCILTLFQTDFISKDNELFYLDILTLSSDIYKNVYKSYDNANITGYNIYFVCQVLVPVWNFKTVKDVHTVKIFKFNKVTKVSFDCNIALNGEQD